MQLAEAVGYEVGIDQYRLWKSAEDNTYKNFLSLSVSLQVILSKKYRKLDTHKTHKTPHSVSRNSLHENGFPAFSKGLVVLDEEATRNEIEKILKGNNDNHKKKKEKEKEKENKKEEKSERKSNHPHKLSLKEWNHSRILQMSFEHQHVQDAEQVGHPHFHPYRDFPKKKVEE